MIYKTVYPVRASFFGGVLAILTNAHKYTGKNTPSTMLSNSKVTELCNHLDLKHLTDTVFISELNFPEGAQAFSDDFINALDYVTKDQICLFISQVQYLLYNTYDKYTFLLTEKAYYDAHARDGIKTTTHSESSAEGKNLQNDTPQQADIPATYEQSQYASSLQKNVAEDESDGYTLSDGATATGRMKEIHDYYDDILEEWTNEFNGLFISKYNN